MTSWKLWYFLSTMRQLMTKIKFKWPMIWKDFTEESIYSKNLIFPCSNALFMVSTINDKSSWSVNCKTKNASTNVTETPMLKANHQTQLFCKYRFINERYGNKKDTRQLGYLAFALGVENSQISPQKNHFTTYASHCNTVHCTIFFRFCSPVLTICSFPSVVMKLLWWVGLGDHKK